MASARRRSSVDAASALQRRMPAPPPSIVRYEAPVLLQGAEGAGKRANARVNTHGVDTKTVEILDKLLPPIEYRDAEGNVFMRYVSRAPATRIDAIATQEALDAAFVQRQARTVGVCAVREALYSQTFDEVIRQVALRLPERGLALLRVRDQLRMTAAAYRTLYTSSTEFGAAKASAASVGVPERASDLDELQARMEQLRAKKLELENVCKTLEAKHAEERASRLARQQHERDAIQYQNTQLHTFVAHAEASGGPNSSPSADTSKEAEGDSSDDD